MEGRQRNLFPLPCTPSSELRPPDFGHRRPCRAVRRRFAAKIQHDRWADDGIQALNQVSGAPFSNPPRHVQNKMQEMAVSRIRSVYSQVAPPPDHMSAAGAFSELCGSASRYSPTDLAKTARYTKDLMSWPPEGSIATPVLDLLEGADFEMVNDWGKTLLRPVEQREQYLNCAERPKPFLEPSLVRKLRVYADLCCLFLIAVCFPGAKVGLVSLAYFL